MYDFNIFSLPRSGSHMLASALDSHPDIRCTGELGNIYIVDDKGKPVLSPIGRRPHGHDPRQVTGCIIQAYHVANGVPFKRPNKMIRLTRDLIEIAASRHYESLSGTSAVQYLTPVERSGVQHEIPGSTVAKLRGLEVVLNAYLGRCTSQILVVDYHDLCDGKDARVLNPKTSNRICDFLGVDRLPLRPLTFKPSSLADETVR